jgi:hypothetical protein
MHSSSWISFDLDACKGPPLQAGDGFVRFGGSLILGMKVEYATFLFVE